MLVRKHEAQPYNPDRIPPDFALAINHGNSFRMSKYQVGPGKPASKKLCPCCRLPRDGEPLPLMCELDSFYQVGTYHLGSGYSLYFHFLKYCIVFLLAMLAVSGLFNLITNLIERDCDETATSTSFCVRGWISNTFLSSKRDESGEISIQLILNLVYVILIMVYSHYMRYQMRKIDYEVDKNLTTPADFTLKVTRVPPDVTDLDLRSWFESFSTMSVPVKCVKVVRTYDTKDINRLESKREEIMNRYKKNSGHVQQVLLQLELTRLQGEVNQKLKEKKFKHTPAVYVTFAKSSMPPHLLHTLKSQQRKTLGSRFTLFSRQLIDMKGNMINVKKAPEPSDVLWKNLGYNNQQKRKSRIMTFLSTLFILAIGFALIILINWAEIQLKDDFTQSSILTRELSILGSALISLINVILSLIIRLLLEVEKHGTKTGFATAYASKTAIALLVNTAFISLIANIVLSENYTFSFNVLANLHKLSIYSPDGLLQNLFYVFVANTFVTPIFNLLDPLYFFQLYIQRKFLKLGEHAVLTQKAANDMFEGPQPNMSNKYAQTIKTMLLTAFYAPGMPIATIFSLLGLFLTYWSDKYLFLRRNALPPALNHQLNTSMLDYLDLMVLSFAAGNMMFTAALVQTDGSLSYTVNSVNVILMWVTLGVSILNYILPMNTINASIFRIKRFNTSENENYDEARKGFSTEYDLENPITRHQVFNDPTSQHSKSKKNKGGIDKNMKARLGDSILSNVLTKMGFNNK